MQDLDTLILILQSETTNNSQKNAAFTEIVRRFQDMVYGCAGALTGDSQLAQDVTQESFLTAYQQVGQLREPKAFPGWLRRIVLTHCHRLARQQRVPTQSLDTAVQFVAADPSPPAVVEAQEMQARVMPTIQTLPETQRLTTILFYINGYSQQEVAEFLEVPVDTVKKRLERARKQLHERLIDMVQEQLHKERPSNNTRLVETIQMATMLETAALEGQVATLEMLLLDGLSVDSRGKDGQTLLHWAAQKGLLDAVELLLQHKATVNLRDKLGKTWRDSWRSGGGALTSLVSTAATLSHRRD